MRVCDFGGGGGGGVRFGGGGGGGISGARGGIQLVDTFWVSLLLLGYWFGKFWRQKVGNKLIRSVHATWAVPEEPRKLA